MNEYYSLSNQELIEKESSLDYKDPDLLQEIFSRAEEYEPGITEAYLAAVRNDSSELPDSVFDRAVRYLSEH